MNCEQIERLAMDSAAEQLNEDVEALLQEYLTEHSEANKWFLDMQEIYENTKVAFNEKTASVTQSIENKPSLKFNWFPVLRWAAVIAIAVCVGAVTGRWSKPTTILQKPPSITAPTDSIAKQSIITPEDILANLDDGFWRDKIAALINTSTVKIRRETNPGLSLWEQYRRYKGEEL